MSNKTQFTFENRELSSFYLSIGTGLMLESVFDPISKRIDDSRIINKIEIDKYKIHYFNIHTLLRNIFSSINSSEIKKMVVKDSNAYKYMVDVLMSELDMIYELYKETNCKPIIYIPNYKRIIDNIPNAITEDTMSDNNRMIHVMINNAIKLFSRSKDTKIDIIDIEHKLPYSSDNVLITTNYPVDLLNVKHIKRLTLIESHTGKLKDKSMFSTKYHKMGSKCNREDLPFTEKLLYLIGDNILIKPIKISLRTVICIVAKEKRWTQFTSQFKMNKELDKIIDYKLKEIY